MSNEQSTNQIGNWASGQDWFLSTFQPKLLFVPGEVFYLFMAWFLWPAIITLKLIAIIVLVAAVAGLMGYSFKGLWRRFWRWVLGNERSVYSVRANRRRFLGGM